MLFFIHIPKAAGTSLRAILRTVLGNRLVPVYAGQPGWQPHEVVARKHPENAVLFGHFWWGFHEKFGAQPCYAAILRHPVERLVSWYNWMGSHPHLPLHRMIRDGTPLSELIRMGASADISNSMVAYIAGGTPRHLEDRPTLERAKRHLREFQFVSVLERFSDDLATLEKLLSVRLIRVPRLNTTSSLYEIDAKSREVVLEYNALDLELHSFAAHLAAERAGW